MPCQSYWDFHKYNIIYSDIQLSIDPWPSLKRLSFRCHHSITFRQLLNTDATVEVLIPNPMGKLLDLQKGETLYFIFSDTSFWKPLSGCAVFERLNAQIFFHLSFPTRSPHDVPNNKGQAWDGEWWSINIIHGLFLKCHFSTSEKCISTDSPPSLWTQVLLPVTLHPVLFPHYVSPHTVKLFLLRSGLSKVIFTGSMNSFFSFSHRYDCSLVDDALCAAGVKGKNCCRLILIIG